METYQTGDGPQQIKMTVDITTIGLAATRAIVGKPGSGNPPSTVGHSVDVTGDIDPKNIGAASDLNGKTLSVMTKVDFSAISDEKARKKECERTTGTYILDNGIEGHKVFFATEDDKTPSDDYTVLIINKEIQFKK